MTRKTINRRHLKDGKVYKVQLEESTGDLYLKGTDIKVEWKHTIHKDQVKTCGVARSDPSKAMGSRKKACRTSKGRILSAVSPVGDYSIMREDGSIVYGDFKTVGRNPYYITGRPGTGKTALTSRYLEYLNQMNEDRSTTLHREIANSLRENVESLRSARAEASGLNRAQDAILNYMNSLGYASTNEPDNLIIDNDNWTL